MQVKLIDSRDIFIGKLVRFDRWQPFG